MIRVFFQKGCFRPKLVVEKGTYIIMPSSILRHIQNILGEQARAVFLLQQDDKQYTFAVFTNPNEDPEIVSLPTKVIDFWSKPCASQKFVHV